MVKVGFGSMGDSFSVASFKSYWSELIGTPVFVFAGVGSAIAYGKLTSDVALDPACLAAVAVAHAFALFVGVSVAANISGGHLNPVVTLGLAISGNITLLIGVFYWTAQCLGPTSLASSSNTLLALHLPTHEVASGVSKVAEFVMGIIIVANILAAGPFSGRSMNPARSFGPAVVSENYSEIWIYCAGSLNGGVLAWLVYGDIFVGSYAPLPNQDNV